MSEVLSLQMSRDVHMLHEALLRGRKITTAWRQLSGTPLASGGAPRQAILRTCYEVTVRTTGEREERRCKGQLGEYANIEEGQVDHALPGNRNGSLWREGNMKLHMTIGLLLAGRLVRRDGYSGPRPNTGIFGRHRPGHGNLAKNERERGRRREEKRGRIRERSGGSGESVEVAWI